MFGLLGHKDGEDILNLKCDPLEAIQLRDIFSAVRPGYHMNKVHWNTIVLDGSLPQGEIERMVDNSYSLVVKTLKRDIQKQLITRFGKSQIHPSDSE